MVCAKLGLFGVRAEDGIENLKIDRLGFGSKVARKYHMVAGGVGAGYRNEGEFKARRLASGQKFTGTSDSGHQHFVEEQQCCLGRPFTDSFTIPAEDLV